MYMVQVDVTRNDIDCGISGNTRRCPVALAMQRAMNAIEPNRFEVMIGGSAFSINDLKKSEAMDFRTPEIAEFFIRMFDENRPVSPFQFSFDMQHGSRGMLHMQIPAMHTVYLYGSWDLPKVPKIKSKKAIGYGFIEPLKYTKIISLEKDIKEVSEVIKGVAEIKEPTIAELEKFISSYEELSPDYALVKL